VSFNNVKLNYVRLYCKEVNFKRNRSILAKFIPPYNALCQFPVILLNDLNTILDLNVTWWRHQATPIKPSWWHGVSCNSWTGTRVRFLYGAYSPGVILNWF